MATFPKIPKHEFKAVLRSLGLSFKPGEKSQAIWERITAQGTSVQTVMAKHAVFKGALRGQTTGGGVSADQVREIAGEVVEDAISELDIKGGGSAAPVDDATLRKLVQEFVAKSEPRVTYIEKDTKRTVKIKGRLHPMFEKVRKLASGRLNVMLCGPAGCGKSYLAEKLAEVLGARTFGMLSCTSGASESQLTGWLLPVSAGGNFTYVSSEFVDVFENGGVFLLDEVDAADPNMLLVINAALANGHLHIPQRHKKPKVTKHKDCIIVAAANTFGTGADAIYVGRNQLDAATLDRFYVVRMDYDVALENDLIAAEDDAAITSFGAWVHAIRSKVALDNRIRRVVSTRMIQKGIAAYRAGIAMDEIKVDLLAGWTRDELNRVNTGV